MSHILDNPIYQSLTTGHKNYAIEIDDEISHYQASIAPFVGFKEATDINFEKLYQQGSENTYVFFALKPTVIPKQWQLLNQIDMFQMVFDSTKEAVETTVAFRDLDETHIEQMLALVKLTQPGPFRTDTIKLSNYTGVFSDDRLIAMAGHRFHPSPYIEVSAVCTHPDFLGKGYAFVLISEQIKRILQKSQTPFLHVRNDNVAAINLYKKLGFEIRTDMICYVIQKNEAGAQANF